MMWLSPQIEIYTGEYLFPITQQLCQKIRAIHCQQAEHGKRCQGTMISLNREPGPRAGNRPPIKRPRGAELNPGGVSNGLLELARECLWFGNSTLHWGHCLS
jgi:hypothetical protein